MARERLRHPENIAGDFFVDTTCIDCDLCRQIAPESFSDIGDQSVVHHQPDTPAAELAALKALITCPTASIGAPGHSAKVAARAYPEQIEDDVYFCGYAAESSFGASSYLVVRKDGNVLVDSPRFARPLADGIAALGGVNTIFLTHQDDVADHKLWAREFDATRVMHRDDIRSRPGIERVLTGIESTALAIDLLAIPTPGHTRGHTVLLYRNRYLFSGDHLWWSEKYQTLYSSPDVCWYSWAEQIRSVGILLQYEFEWVLPGHGRRAHAAVTEMRRHLSTCLDLMKTATREDG